jgi:hypothetical protein
LRSVDPSLFRSKNYDYLLARIAEETSDIATSTAGYESTVTNNSILAEYALWHLARVARSTGDLVLERERLRHLVSLNPGSILYDAATLRLTESFLESGDFSAGSNQRPCSRHVEERFDRSRRNPTDGSSACACRQIC